MKTETHTHDVTSADIRLHQKWGHRALRLEMAGDYIAAELAWWHTAKTASLPQWRMFTRERACGCQILKTTGSFRNSPQAR